MRSIVLTLALLLPACGGAVASAPDAPAELADDASAPQDARQVERLPRPSVLDASAPSACHCEPIGLVCDGKVANLPAAEHCDICCALCGTPHPPHPCN